MVFEISNTSIVLLVAILGVSLLFILNSFPSQLTLSKLPPGPPKAGFFSGTPIPSQHSWRQFSKWTQEYGDIFTIRLGPARLLFVLGTATSANSILEKDAGKTADRPRQIFAGELMSNNMRMLILKHGERWRIYRKILHDALQEKSAKAYEPIQLKESRITIQQCGEQPSRFQDHFKRYAASVIMTLTYDQPITCLSDKRVKAVSERLGDLAKFIKPGASFLDKYPFMLFLPDFINPWKREGKRLHKLELELFLSQYQDVRTRVENRTSNAPSFSSKLQEKQKELGLSDEEASYLAGSLFGAGSDTTASALSIFVMAMIRFPEALKRLQQEVDAVVAENRMPTFEDAIPCVRSTVQEVLRWRPVSSGGFLHSLTEDVVYRGYVLPKDSAVVGNHWSISLDPNEYKDPETFDPARFLSSEESNGVKGTWFQKQRGSVAFGFGRRICPGFHVAERSLAINIASLAWAFDILPPEGMKPEQVDTLAFDSGANSHPLPFQARFIYRSERRKQIAEEEVTLTADLQATDS